jgi:hypothetical protein
MIIDIVCTFSATTIQAETKSVSLVLTFPATQLPSNICEEVQDCLGISPSGEADYFLNEQGDWVQVSGGGAVDSVNGQTGVVVLDANDVGAPSGSGTSTGTNSGDNATNTTSNSYADAKVADAINDGVTTIAPSQNAVFDALALKQNALGFTPENVANKSDSFTASSTTTYANTKALVDGLATKQNTLVLAADYTDVAFTASSAPERIIRVLPIPKGTVPINGTLHLSLLLTKTGTGSQTSIRLRVATTATPPSLGVLPILAAASSLTAATVFMPFQRNNIHIQSATSTLSFGNAGINDFPTGTAVLNNSYDWDNVDYWLIFTMEHNTTSADAYTSHGLILSL